MDEYGQKIPSRASRNQELYKEISKAELDNYEVRSNEAVIGDNKGSIDVEKIKSILDTHYKDAPKRRSIAIEDEEIVKTKAEETKEYDISDSEVSIDMALDTPEKIDLFAQFLAEVPYLKIPSPQFHERFATALDASGLTTGMTAALIPSVFDKIKEIADNHNMYFDNLSKYNLSKVVNNYTMYSMYRTINDPVNLIQA